MTLTYYPGVAGPVVRPLTYFAPGAVPAGDAVYLPGNLLSIPDSDFESPLSGDWTASNATAAISGLQAFHGHYSLAVTAATTGTVTVSVASPYLTGYAKAGYVLSGYARTSAASISLTPGLACYNSVPALISTPAGTAQALTPNTWTPFTAAVASPAATASITPKYTITGLTANQVVYLDLLYVARPMAQILAAFPTQPASTSPLFCDITMWARADTPISLTRGRQDNLNDVQPGQLSLTAANDQGWLTPGNTSSPWYPNVKIGRRIQVSTPDETGTWHTRFDGQISEYGLIPLGEPGLAADVQIQAADVLALLGRQTGLDSWTKREILLDTPLYHWTLDDPAGSSVAAESSGNNGPALQLHRQGAGGTYAFAGGTAVTASGQQNGMETQTWPKVGTPAAFPSVYFAQAAGGGRTSQQNWQLQAPLPAPIVTYTNGAAWTIEGFLIPDVPNASTYTNATPFAFWAFALGNTRTGQMLGVWVNGGATPTLQASYYGDYLDTPPAGQLDSATFNWPSSTPGPVHAAITMSGTGGGTSIRFYVNGSLISTIAGVLGGLSFNYITCGGPLGGYNGWLGQVACLSVYNSVLPTGRMTAHSTAAKSGQYGNQAGAIINTLTGYAGVPAFWNNIPAEVTGGLSGIDYFTLQGSNALTAMQQAEAVDGGLLFVDALGRLNYTGRESRMGAGAPALTLTAGSEGQVEADLGYKINDQYLVNEAGVSAPGITTGVGVVNAGSVADYGEYPQGTAASPNEAPHLTFNAWFQAYLNSTGGTVNAFVTDNLTSAAQWAANSKAQPQPKGASVRADMLTMPLTGPDALLPSTLLGLEIGSVIAIAGLPSQFPNVAHSNEFFIEGVTETIGLGVRDIAFYTSPASQGRAWIPGDATYGQLDSTAVIGRSAPTTATPPASESAGLLYPGPPYYPPVYGNTMNTTGFAGDLDQAGIWATLQQQLQPPMAVLQQNIATQSVASGTGTVGTRVTWDTVVVDTLGGNGWLAGFPNWYFILVPGWWQLYGCVQYALNATGKRTAWFAVAHKAASGGTGPVLANANIIGSADIQACTNSWVTGVCLSAKAYLELGTAVAVQTWQNSGGALNTSLARGGSMFAARFLGDTTVQD